MRATTLPTAARGASAAAARRVRLAADGASATAAAATVARLLVTVVMPETSWRRQTITLASAGSGPTLPSRWMRTRSIGTGESPGGDGGSTTTRPPSLLMLARSGGTWV